MMFPGEQAMRAERGALIATLESLSDDEFESGTTLCSEWTPRDIVAHVMGIDYALPEYVRAKMNINKANAEIVRKARAMSRDRLMRRARHWADRPSPMARATASYFLGDLAMHHQDILRGLGRSREVPSASASAMMREAVFLSMVLQGSRKLLAHRIVPTDGGRPIGRGTTVSGTREALALWLAGREGIEVDLEFDGSNPPAHHADSTASASLFSRTD